MGKFTCILVLAISISNTLIAQQSYSERNAGNDSSELKVGFKQNAASSASAGKKSAAKNSNTLSINDQKTAADKNITSPVKHEDAAKISEIMKVDYSNMPADVQAKINNNKSKGRNLLEGIAKIFTVEIKSCITDADHKKALLFLKLKKGFINSQFVSTGLVKISVEPTFDAADLKEAMAAEGIQFNFLNRSYLLKNNYAETIL